MDSSIDLGKNLNEYDKKFIKILNQFRVKSKPISHTGVGKTAGKFLIDNSSDIKLFYKAYNECASNGNMELSLIEQHTDICPIIVDLDFRYKDGVTERSYDKEFIKKVVEIYIKNIKEYFDLDEEEHEELLQAFIFERPGPYLFKDNLKDGIHIIFPFIVSKPDIQYIIRENVIKEAEPFFNELPIKNKISAVLDKEVIENVGWYMYRSTKPGVQQYQFTMLIDHNLNSLPIDDYEESSLPELLSIRNKTETTSIKDCYLDQINEHREKMKSKLLSKKKSREISFSDLSREEIQDIYELVSMLSDDRADDFEDWIRVGWALHNREPDSDDLLNIWDDFSQRSAKYEPGCCEKAWTNEMKDNGLNIGSLYFWASQDSPEKYKEFYSRQTRTFMDQSLNGTNVDVAKVLHKMYRYEYVCSSTRNKKWYRFNKHRWIEDEDGTNLRSKISNEMVNEYCKLISVYNDRLNDLDDELEEDGINKKRKQQIENQVKSLENKIDKLTTITTKLKTTSFKDNIMRECRDLFYDKDFIQKLDSNETLICMQNGVLDLNTGVFRNGRPDDFISLTCAINYVPYADDLPHLKDIIDFIQKIQPNPNNYHYMMVLLSSLIDGYNRDESFHLFTGLGGNGKSKINELLVSALGEYASKFPITLLTGKRASSNAASPEVVESKGKRYCFFEEPSNNERINVGLMKEYTGGDLIKGRNLFSGNFIQFKPQFKLILFCNDLPKVPPEDGGTWRRIKVLEFQSMFVDNPKHENEFKKDKNITKKIPKWTTTFFSLLTHYYFNYYKKEGLKIPQEVTKYTEEYQNSMDNFGEFLIDRFIQTNDRSDKLTLSFAHEEFKLWFQDSFNHKNYPSKRELKKYLEKKLGKKIVTMSHIFGFVKKPKDAEENIIEEAELEAF